MSGTGYDVNLRVAAEHDQRVVVHQQRVRVALLPARLAWTAAAPVCAVAPIGSVSNWPQSYHKDTLRFLYLQMYRR